MGTLAEAQRAMREYTGVGVTEPVTGRGIGYWNLEMPQTW